MSTGREKPRVGELRPSQILTTFGIGSIVDLPHISVMVMGLEDWPNSDYREITEERLVISINKDQRVYLGNDAININDIGKLLRQRIRDPRHQSIFVRADENIPFGVFATVMDAVKQAGFANVSIVTQPMDTNASKH